MPRDYAKQRVLQPSARKKRGRILAISIIASIMMLMMSFMWLHHHNVFKVSGTSWKSFFAHKKTKTPVEKKISNPSSEEVQFDFYTELPNMQVSPAVMASPEESPVQKLSSSYIIQVGIFESVGEAGEARLSLLLNGLETDIIEVNENDQKRYRLERRGLTNMAQAQAMQKQFQNKGFVANIVGA